MTKTGIVQGLAALVLLAGAGAGQADEDRAGWRPFVVAGLTRGGDVIDESTVLDSSGAPKSTQRLYAGNLVQFGAGAMWTARSLPLSIALSANYHFDDMTGRTENTTFIRYPLEAIAYYVTEARDWRAGLGFRYVYRPRIKGKYPEQTPRLDYEVKFENTTGLVAETGWAVGDNAWLNVRAVRELYKYESQVVNGVYTDLSGLTGKVNGSHVGINLLYAF